MDDILNGLLKSDIEVLDFVWESFLRNGEWPAEQVFRKRLKDQLGKGSLDSSLVNLEGVFLFKTHNGSHDKSYQLTFEGCCVVERKTGDFNRVLCVYLDHVKRIYNERPDIVKINSTELSQALSTEEMSKLIAYIHLGNLWGLASRF